MCPKTPHKKPPNLIPAKLSYLTNQELLPIAATNGSSLQMVGVSAVAAVASRSGAAPRRAAIRLMAWILMSGSGPVSKGAACSCDMGEVRPSPTLHSVDKLPLRTAKTLRLAQQEPQGPHQNNRP